MRQMAANTLFQFESNVSFQIDTIQDYLCYFCNIADDVFITNITAIHNWICTCGPNELHYSNFSNEMTRALPTI